MKKFETPDIDVLFLSLEDIITTSSETDPDMGDINDNLADDQLPIG